MNIENCFHFICFVQLDSEAPKIFGFSEFLASLALMVLAWTIADVRYRFRLRTTPFPIQGLTYFIVSTIGILTLLTDLWRAEEWFVPKGHILTPASWQAVLGGIFLFTFLIWAWYAFIRPSTFNKFNAKRYLNTLYKFILKGSPNELSVIADELTHSIESIIDNATNGEKYKKVDPNDISDTAACANEILLLIADRKFCKAIVDTSPGTALALYNHIGHTKKYRTPIGIFSKNLINTAFNRKDSFLYNEAEGYKSGLMGYQKPLSHAIFSNYEMVEEIGSLLDPDVWGKTDWDSDQWEAYCHVVLLTFKDYIKENFQFHSYTLYRAKGNIEHATSELYKLNESEGTIWQDEPFRKTNVVSDFIKKAIEIIDENGIPDNVNLHISANNHQDTFFDHLASMIFELIFSASYVRSPHDLCWWIQHNEVWSKFFNFKSLDTPAGKIVKFKVRRLIYNEIISINKFANFKNAKILGFCINVMGLSLRNDDYDIDSKALHKATLIWVKKNFDWLYSYNPRIAEAALVEGLEYDVENSRIVKTSPAEGLSAVGWVERFFVKPNMTMLINAPICKKQSILNK